MLSVEFIENNRIAYQEYFFYSERRYVDVELRNKISISELFTTYYKGTVSIRRDLEVLGLCSLFYNEALQVENQKSLCFGYYECDKDLSVAQLLMQEVERIAREQNCTRLLGPLNGSTWNNYRFSMGEIDTPFFTERYHKPYYYEQFSALNYSEIAHYESRIDRELKLLSQEKKEQIERHWHKRNLKIRNIDLSNFTEEITLIHSFCLDAFQRNLFYTPISAEDFLRKYKPIEELIDPDFVLIAEENDEIIGLIFAIPDFYCKSEKRLIVKTIAKKSGVRYAGISHLLGEELVARAKSKKYAALIHAFMHIENASKQISRQFSGTPFRQYVLFSKTLENE